MEKNTLIRSQELAQIMATEPVVLIDTRDPEVYAEGHLPGAVNIREIFSHLATSTPEGAASMQKLFADLLGGAGLSGVERAVIYEDAMNNGYGQSCRGYFLLKYLGYPCVSILHGGYKAWQDAGLPTTTDLPTPERKSFPVALQPELMMTTPEMLEAIRDPKVVNLDVRDWVEWVGESSSPYGVDFAPRKGRIPGAVLIEWYAFMNPGTDEKAPEFKSPEEIRDLASKVGITPETPVNIYCFKGARASNAFVALNQAGIENCRIYFSSWNEWSRDPSLPIETGAPDPSRPAVRA
ncbi:MAG: sulfurtransferase [Cytophagales bacterium]|nr:sulfurtransferase [Armatimonadota bacterium]